MLYVSDSSRCPPFAKYHCRGVQTQGDVYLYTYCSGICCLLQSKLNCEVLYDELAFEVRWAVAGDSIVLQLVAKLGQCHTAE